MSPLSIIFDKIGEFKFLYNFSKYIGYIYIFVGYKILRLQIRGLLAD